MRELVAGTGPESRAEGRRGAADDARRRQALPADALLRPVAILALGLMILNDHFLKAAWPGPVTGKLSDAAGLVVFPLFLQGALEVGLWLGGRWRAPDQRLLAICVVATVVVFALVKTVPTAHDIYAAGWGFLQWLPGGVAALVSGAAQTAPWHVRLVVDPTDLLCLPAALIPLWLGHRRVRRSRQVTG